MNNIEFSLIIPAGGSGKRFGSEIPKQFLEINNKPIISYTIEKFLTFKSLKEIIIPCKSDWIEFLSDLTKNFSTKITIISGGNERFESVYLALKKVKTKYVLVHDAVRPFVNIETIEKVLSELTNNNAVIPVTAAIDTIKKVDTNGFVSETLNRNELFYVQTPQGFITEFLKNANEDLTKGFIPTDDASIIEKAGGSIKTVIGNSDNFKITSKIDLEFAEIKLKREYNNA